MFLAPATAALALSIYGQIDVLKKNLLPIAAGTLVGSLTSIISVLGLCKLFGLSDELTASLIPKSVTTPIAMEISQQQGGIVSITVAAVIVTGIFGAIFAPTLLKLFRVKDRWRQESPSAPVVTRWAPPKRSSLVRWRVR